MTFSKKGMFVFYFPHPSRNEINFSFIYKAEFRGQSKEIGSIKKVNIVKKKFEVDWNQVEHC